MELGERLGPADRHDGVACGTGLSSGRQSARAVVSSSAAPVSSSRGRLGRRRIESAARDPGTAVGALQGDLILEAGLALQQDR
jgi:hypothetical protein